ncbi:MAG: aminoacyl-tRNA hydrolase [bacterium]
MKLIIGLGNPGLEYKSTRHNIGFEVIDKLAFDFNININKNKFRAMYGEGIIHGQKVLLIKPLTYMNLSGESVRDFVNFYKDIILEEDVLVICDDINLNVGSIKLKKKGSAGGQNGMKNIIYQLGTDDFPRLRVGIGKRPSSYTLSDFVLSKFTKEELLDMQGSVEMSSSAIEVFVKDKEKGIDNAMNIFNKKNNLNKKNDDNKKNNNKNNLNNNKNNIDDKNNNSLSDDNNNKNNKNNNKNNKNLNSDINKNNLNKFIGEKINI